MNTTNRGLNRLFILLTGVLLLAAGSAAVGLGAVPVMAAQWKQTAAMLQSSPQPWVADPFVGQASLLVLAVALVAVVLIALLIAFIAKQGHGRTAAALRQHDDATSTHIDLAVPKALLEEHLGTRDVLVGLRISAYEVRGTPMLKITARCRRGVSPATVAELVGSAITDLEQIIGTNLPTFVQLTGGFHIRGRARPQVA